MTKTLQIISGMSFEFISPVRGGTIVEVEEAHTKTVDISGILLREGVSRNNNLYTIEEMANIAEQAEGLPVFVGTMRKRDPNTGIIKTGMHADIASNRVGKIIEVFFDRLRRVIRFVARIQNTKAFPRIVEEVKKGWGISIGGVADKAKVVLDETKRVLYKISGMILNHIQLLEPWKQTGVEGAKVESVEIQESMTFKVKKLDHKKLTAIIHALIQSGDINV